METYVDNSELATQEEIDACAADGIRALAKAETKESAIDFLRRWINHLGYEDESILQALPSPQAFLEFVALIEHYDVDFLQGIHEAIAEGADVTPYSAFRDKWVSAIFGGADQREDFESAFCTLQEIKDFYGSK